MGDLAGSVPAIVRVRLQGDDVGGGGGKEVGLLFFVLSEKKM